MKVLVFSLLAKLNFFLFFCPLCSGETDEAEKHLLKNIHLHSLAAQLDNADVEEEEMDNISSFTSKLQTDHEKNGELTHSCSNN